MPRVSIVHDTPGRLRVRLPHGARRVGLGRTVEGYRGVTSAKVSPHTGSLLVHYRPEETSTDTLVEALEFAASKLVLEPETETGTGPDLPPPLAVALTRTAADVNAAVERATNGHVDLRVLVALGMTAWGIWRLTHGRRGWHQPLWYGYSLLMDYSSPRPARAVAEAVTAATVRSGRRARALRAVSGR